MYMYMYIKCAAKRKKVQILNTCMYMYMMYIQSLGFFFSLSEPKAPGSTYDTFANFEFYNFTMWYHSSIKSISNSWRQWTTIRISTHLNLHQFGVVVFEVGEVDFGHGVDVL